MTGKVFKGGHFHGYGYGRVDVTLVHPEGNAEAFFFSGLKMSRD